jgi:membrane-associated phospholipid phosphatase
MKARIDLLRYLSHLVSAPVIAAPIFVSLAALENARLVYTLASIVFASVIPIVGILYFAKSDGMDYDIPERDARARPFVFAIASYLAGFVLLVLIGAPFLMSGLMLAYSINTSVMFIVTLSWKISVHAAGVTGPLTFLVFRLGLLWSLLYLLVIPVGLLRFRLGQHTFLQLLAGAVLSAALTWTEIIFLVPLLP